MEKGIKVALAPSGRLLRYFLYTVQFNSRREHAGIVIVVFVFLSSTPLFLTLELSVTAELLFPQYNLDALTIPPSVSYYRNAEVSLVWFHD